MNTQPAEKRDARRAALRSVSFEKVCSTCRQLKSQSEYTNHAGQRDGLFNECNACKALRKRRSVHSITKEELSKMMSISTCEMPSCGNELDWKKETHIDHCHKTGKVRAVLCRRCNTMLGHIEKNMHLVYPMLDYINEHKGGNEAA